jgi:hypothetical protein
MRRWLARYPWTIGLLLVSIALGVVFYRQQQNFDDHKRIDREHAASDRRESRRICEAQQQAWQSARAIAAEFGAEQRARLLILIGPKPACDGRP